MPVMRIGCVPAGRRACHTVRAAACARLMHAMKIQPPIVDRLGQAATLALPLFLTHGRGLAEVTMDLLSVLFMIRCVVRQDWCWSRQPWFVVSLAWWGWQVFCSLPVTPFGIGGVPAFGQALLAIRFLMMAAAMQNWTLRDAVTRLWMRRILVICGCYIAMQIVVQAIFGHNLFGVPRFPDGTLTGPYAHPRAAAPLSRLLLPILMLACADVLRRTGGHGWRSLGGMGAVVVAGVAVMVLAGQRIPFALTLLGLFICAALFRPMRPAALLAGLLLPVIVTLVRVFSPGSFQHLVILAHRQLMHFGQSSYGAIFTRAWVMAADNPITGLGYDAFRHGCGNPRYFHGRSWLNATPDGGGAAICVQHAHNHYLQALTNGGVPELMLFVAMVLAWLATILPRNAHASDRNSAWRIGLFAAVFIQEWPIASSSDLLNLPLGGWAFLLLGVALAETRPPVTCERTRLYPEPNTSSVT